MPSKKFSLEDENHKLIHEWMDNDLFLETLTSPEWNCIKNVYMDKQYGFNYQRTLNEVRIKWIEYLKLRSYTIPHI